MTYHLTDKRPTKGKLAIKIIITYISLKVNRNASTREIEVSFTPLRLHSARVVYCA